MYDTCRASFQDKFIMSQCGIYDVTSRSILILFPTLYRNEKIFYIIRSGYEKKLETSSVVLITVLFFIAN